jgi:hypothetical protein
LRRYALSRWCCNCLHRCKSDYELGYQSISIKFRSGSDLSATEPLKFQFLLLSRWLIFSCEILEQHAVHEDVSTPNFA